MNYYFLIFLVGIIISVTLGIYELVSFAINLNTDPTLDNEILNATVIDKQIMAVGAGFGGTTTIQCIVKTDHTVIFTNDTGHVDPHHGKFDHFDLLVGKYGDLSCNHVLGDRVQVQPINPWQARLIQ